MHPLITKLLKKKNLRIEELDPDEMAQMNSWQEALSENEVTVESITAFIQSQKELIENDYSNPDNSQRKNTYYRSSLAIYKALLAYVEKSKVSRERVIKEIEKQFQK